MVEIGTAYLSIVAETSGLPKQIKSALRGVDSQGAEAGRSMGSKMSGALAGALKAGAAGAAAAGVATLGTAMVKGFQRLDAIDQAKAKLSGLGNSASDVSKIMDNALSAVRGTAFGMGDAAGLAGTMVAAGIKPGKELESTLKRVADSAAIAGTDLGDMGQIWGKAAAKGKVDGEIINQMLERQIPIYDILGKKMGKNAEEIADMVSKGKISFQDFSDAMNDKIGGAALKTGDTVRGAFNNMKASLGRLGASALEPFFKQLPAGFGSITNAIDGLEPKVKALSAAFGNKVFNEWGPKLKQALDSAKSSGFLDSTVSAFRSLGATVSELWPNIVRIGTELGKASAAVGVGTWQIFVGSLRAVTGVLDVLNPALKFIGGLMEKHPALVTAAVGAWALFKTVPSTIGRVTDAVAGQMSGIRQQATSFGNTVKTAYSVGAAGATRFHRTTGVAAVGLTGLQRAGSGLMGMFGGPWGAALAGAGIAVGMLAAEHEKAKARAMEQKASEEALAKALVETGIAWKKSRGALTDDTLQVVGQGMDAFVDNIKQTGAAFGTFGVAVDNGLRELGMTHADLGKQMLGTNQQWEAFTTRLVQTAPGVAFVTDDLDRMRGVMLEQQEIGRRVTPGIAEVGEAMRVLGDKSATAADKLTAIKTAMDALNPARSKADAMKQMGDSLRSAAEATAAIGPDAFDASGALAAMGESGGKLSDVLQDLATKQQQVASSGDPAAIASANQRIEATLQGLADATNRPIEKIRELYASFGGGENIDLMVKLSGAPEVTQDIGKIVAKMNAVPGTKKVEFETGVLSEQTLAMLENMGVKIKRMPDGKTIQVDVTGDAGAKLRNVVDTAAQIPAGKAVVTSAPGGQAVYQLLKGMGVEVRENNDKTIIADIPAGSPVLQMLRDIGYEVDTRNGKTVIVKADDTDYANKKPEWTKDEMKTIRVVAQASNELSGSWFGGRANGAIVPYVNGGIAAAEAFANGGFKQIRKPQNADLFAGRGAGTIFAEEETGGEAYIPLAPGKRKRSTDILATVAEMFGMSLVPADSVSGLLGGIAGGAVSKLLQKAGADRLTRFADGGFSGKQLRDLADGQGASGPLTGAPYNWGGVNWGDCSGAMSAFTRAAVGLSPFGGRWSTGSAAGDLAAMGYQQGDWQPGTMGVGFMNGGPGGGHTAGTLPDGTNVEMGGSYGGGMVGGSVGANDPQFTDRWFVPVEAGAASFDPFRPFQDQHEADPNYQPGSQSGSTSGTGTGGGDSISSRFGNAASAFVSENVADILGVFGINDSPGVLKAWNQFEQGRGNNGTQPQTQGVPSDPGTHEPAEGEDTGGDTVATGIDGIKDAFKRGLREAWRTGAEWDATDWIVNKESSWKPDAVNGKYRGLIQAGEEVYRAAGVDPNTLDPAEQAKAFDKYVEGRYKVPTAAEEFHKANNWYDAGGVAQGVGMMLKNTIKPERVLSPSQTAAFEQGMRNGFGADGETVGLLRELIGVIRDANLGTTNVTVRDDREYYRQARQRDRGRIYAGSGGR
ncbi:MAG: tape measure protein [Gordonia sp. (in: high G+C Gram-positive bacteria)]|uniref:aggregation-promoting factor C-terminal-like domain-containing protein n=1 Tax=Gordonia sp. (in: high G+C Gram-positive bacteria) TaxID=84139 RepID=UPI003C71AFBC